MLWPEPQAGLAGLSTDLTHPWLLFCQIVLSEEVEKSLGQPRQGW